MPIESDAGRSVAPPIVAPASVGQRLLWLLSRYRARDTALNCPIVCRLDGPLDIERLREALGLLVDRHEALRTTLERRGRKLWQVVHPVLKPQLQLTDMGDESHPERRSREAIDAELRTQIDVRSSPIRARLWRISELRHMFCLNVHHMVTDAWSGAVLMRDLKCLYEAGSEPAPKLPAIGLQYQGFVAQQEEYFRGAAFERDRRYWQSRLAGATYDSIPLHFRSTSADRDIGATSVCFGSGQSDQLKSVARQSKTTQFAVMLTLYFVAIHRLTGSTDVCVASMFANRLRADVRETVGFVANLVAVRATIAAGISFRVALSRVHEELRDAFMHQSCPLHLLPAEVTARNGRRADEAVFQMLPQPMDGCRIGDVEVTMETPLALESRFDFETTVIESQDQLSAIVFWDRNRLADEWVSTFLDEYRAAIHEMLRDLDSLI